MDDKKKYTPMENVLNNINRSIALLNVEKKRNNVILNEVTNTIINLMRQRDPLFNDMYEQKFYGGSYYDNLKVGQPNEFDLDLLLNLPSLSKPCVKCSDQAGFVYVAITEYFKVSTMPEAKRKIYEKLEKLLDQTKFLSTSKFLSWMESVITSALNGMLKDEENGTYVEVNADNEITRIYVKLSRGAPAFTFKLSSRKPKAPDTQLAFDVLDVDLVPCFQFDSQQWPSKQAGYRLNTSKDKKKFLVVPKQPKSEAMKNSPVLGRYWRLSFQEQERELISQDLKTLKPALRLLKKLRDQYNHKIASYFIKTIFLWALEDEEVTFWHQPLSPVFMSMLKKYAERVREKKIPYYWNSNLNLIEDLKDVTKTGIANTLQRLIADVERNLIEPNVDPCTIGKYLLSSAEFEQLKEVVPLGKKYKREISLASTSTATVDTPDSGSSENSPPLVTVLNFEPSTAEKLRRYSDFFEVRQKRDTDDIMAQMNSRFNGLPNNNDMLEALNRIDEKMDKMLERFDKSDETNREIISKFTSLEDKVKQLQLENEALKSKLNGTESGDVNNCINIDAVLSSRQIKNLSSFKQ